MAYRIVSPRIGTPGDEFVPVAGVNLDALLEHGFIVEVKTSKPATGKPASGKVKPNKESE